MLSHPLVLLLNKPKGITSHTAIKQVQKSVQCKKIGHCGTLDKFASGLLIVLLNKATRLSQFFLRLPKTYVAEICFGKTTDTLDPEGTVIAEASVPQLKDIEKALSLHFTGTILQSPPQYSAVHIHGERASKRARRGEQFEVAPREVNIFSYSIIKYEAPVLTLFLHVSSGTYVRSLARDIAQCCNSVAYLSGLERGSIADISLQESCALYSIQSLQVECPCVMSPDVALERIHILKRCYTDEAIVRKKVSMGVMPDIVFTEIRHTQADFVSLHDTEGLVGIWKTSPTYKLVC